MEKFTEDKNPRHSLSMEIFRNCKKILWQFDEGQDTHLWMLDYPFMYVSLYVCFTFILHYFVGENIIFLFKNFKEY